MAWTQTDLGAIEAAISSGTKLVRYGDRVEEYQTTRDMLAARDAIRSDLAQQAARASGRRSRGPLRVIVTKDL